MGYEVEVHCDGVLGLGVCKLEMHEFRAAFLGRRFSGASTDPDALHGTGVLLFDFRCQHHMGLHPQVKNLA